MRDLVIIGGGAASQAAAMYALGKQIDFLLICDRFGGRVVPAEPADRDYLVGNILVHFDYPDAEDDEQHLIGSSAVRLFERQLARQTGRVLYDCAISVRRDGPEFVVETSHGALIRSGAVILATGATPRVRRDVPGGQYVEALGYSATSSAEGLGDREVAVLGESEQAVYTAAELARRARQVYLVLPSIAWAERPEVAMLQRQPNIEVLPGYALSAVRKEEENLALVLTSDDETIALSVAAAFADFGFEPASAIVRDLVKTTPDGFVQVDRGCATSVPGIFAAGDVTRPEGEQVLAAIGDGARAARSAHFFLLTRPAVAARALGQGR